MIKKIFGFLIVTAVCVVIGTFILNKGLPNASHKQLIPWRRESRQELVFHST